MEHASAVEEYHLAASCARVRFRDAALNALAEAEDHEAVERAWSRIEENFDDLFTEPEDIQPLRQTILQLAVRGKLVRQDEKDGNADDLLSEIRNQKQDLYESGQIKRPKKTEPVNINDVDFNVPVGWAWCRLGEVALIKTGKLDANAASKDGQYPFFTCAKYPTNIDSYAYNCECVLLAGNGNFDVNYYDGKFEAYQRTYIIEPPTRGVLSVRYLFAFMRLYSEVLKKNSIGGVISYIKIGHLTDAPYPLPPIAEQHRIVAKVDELMDLCDTLETSLERAKTTREQFATSISDALTSSESVPEPEAA